MFRAAAGVVINLQGRVAAKKGNRVLVRAIAFFYMQRLPRTVFFILSHTKRVLRRMAHRRLGNFVRLGPANIDDNQPQCPAYSSVGAKTVTQGVMAAVDANLLANGAVDNGHRRG